MAPEYLHTEPGFAFEGALRDIAGTHDVTTARWVAKTLEYPTAGLTLAGPGWPWELALRAVGMAVAATVLTLVAILLVGRARRVPETSTLRPAGRFKPEWASVRALRLARVRSTPSHPPEGWI